MNLHTVERWEPVQPVLFIAPRYLERGKAVAERLRYVGYSVVSIAAPTLELAAEAVAEHYINTEVPPENSPLVIIAGDGGFDAARKILKSPLILSRTEGRVAEGSMDGGYGRDIRRGSHGILRKPPDWLLEHSVVVPVHYLTIDKELPDGKRETTEATVHIGIGKTASGAALTNAVRDGESGLRRAVRVGLGTIFENSSFTARINGSKPRDVSDITASFSGHIAKYGRLPTQLWAAEFHVSMTGPGLAQGMSGAARLFSGRSAGYNTQHPFEIELLNDTKMHHNGDKPEELLEGTKLTIRLSDDTYWLQTSRWQPRLAYQRKTRRSSNN